MYINIDDVLEIIIFPSLLVNEIQLVNKNSIKICNNFIMVYFRKNLHGTYRYLNGHKYL